MLITEFQFDICEVEFQLCWEYYDIIVREWEVRLERQGYDVNC